jgi:hypothetical protein
MKLQRLPFLMVALCASVALADSKPDLSSPKSAAMAFGTALLAGDSAGIKATSMGTDNDFKVVDAMGQMVGAMKKLSDAAVAKWGKDNALSKGSMAPDIQKELEESEVKIDGDSATIIKKDKSDAKSPMKLKKVDGNWKVDLGSLPKEGMDQLVKMAPAMAKAAAEVSAEIAADKYKTADEAQQALGAKMLAAMMQAAPPPGGAPIPPAPPAPPEK